MRSFVNQDPRVRELRGKISASGRWPKSAEEVAAWRAEIQEIELRQHIDAVLAGLPMDARHHLAAHLLAGNTEGYVIARVRTLDPDGSVVDQ